MIVTRVAVGVAAACGGFVGCYIAAGMLLGAAAGPGDAAAHLALSLAIGGAAAAPVLSLAIPHHELGLGEAARTRRRSRALRSGLIAVGLLTYPLVLSRGTAFSGLSLIGMAVVAITLSAVIATGSHVATRALAPVLWTPTLALMATTGLGLYVVVPTVAFALAAFVPDQTRSPRRPDAKVDFEPH